MEYHTTVKLVVDDEQARPIPGIQVTLFDRDRLTRDDELGTATTDAAGEAEFRFSSRDFMDVDEMLGGEYPDLYAVLRAPSGETLLSTRALAVDNSVARQLCIRVPAELVAQHQPVISDPAR